jgi:glycerol-3-phosphate cytidylyltransferase
LRGAKEKCDKLVVGVSNDDVVFSYKHKKPVVPFEERIRLVKAVRYVDFVVEQNNMDKLKAWEKLHYNIMFHGSDWKNSSMYNDIEMQLKKVGVKVEFLPHTEGVSSTILSEKISEK